MLENSIKSGINDADSDTRIFSRKTFWLFNEHFPKNAEREDLVSLPSLYIACWFFYLVFHVVSNIDTFLCSDIHELILCVFQYDENVWHVKEEDVAGN